VIAAVGGGLWWWFLPPTPAEVANDYRAVAARTLRLDYTTPDAHVLARQFVARGGVPGAVYDLGTMQYQLVGGRVRTTRGEPRTIAVYRGARGESLICEMYFAAPPPRSPIAHRTHNGIDFAIHQDGDVVMVFWREGAVTCVLASTMDPEALIQLAFTKAGRRP
jgi:anti-sigma factor RsiW